MSNPRFIKAMQTAMRGKEWVDQAVAQALKTMNVPTRTEFKRAVARIEVLERELEEARRAAEAARARPRRAPARAGGGKKDRKAGARKRAARATSAKSTRRATGKKAATSAPAAAAPPPATGEAPAE